MREVRALVNTKTVTDGADENVDFTVPKWAVGALFMFEVSAMSGTTETLDLKFQHKMPYQASAFKDVLGASIVQLTAAANILLTIDPRITAAANVTVAQALSSSMRAVIATGFGGGDESYTYSLSVEFYS